jgi:beta-1,4-mannosyl-glycoprotein beta-1,4-N-acetylglucosaminyltransferase
MKKFLLFIFCLTTLCLHGKIYDCFTFFNELEILKIRLEELYDEVDYFVIVEATKTFSGNAKPLFYSDNLNAFEKYKDKVIHVIVDDYPNPTGNAETDNWARERHQRNSIMRGLSHCSDEDIIFISDADELVRFDVVRKTRERLESIRHRSTKANIVAFDLTNYSVQLNRQAKTRWPGPAKAAKFWVVKRLSPEKLRLLHQTQPDLFMIRNAGWHFNTMGDFERTLLKWQSCSTSYQLQGRTLNALELEYNNFMAQHTPMPIDESFPKHLRENIEYYRSIGWIAE